MSFEQLQRPLNNLLVLLSVVVRSEQLKDKETPTYEEWLKLNNVDYGMTYLNIGAGKADRLDKFLKKIHKELHNL